MYAVPVQHLNRPLINIFIDHVIMYTCTTTVTNYYVTSMEIAPKVSSS